MLLEELKLVMMYKINLNYNWNYESFSKTLTDTFSDYLRELRKIKIGK